ncbi:S9 family peptidase [Marinilactibacillus psychrotolerans]|uniref:Dipeptidyl aminopeptidase / acylaminoacyl-peptidase n=1 Tax=Marinilactibacillus psychrotolerans TaxID=191770 RepID=A0AAV3WNZ4_9LACT|nr:S9 family peptidase [Marinilactibacillus psychrotolerans]GEL65993.1 peptidase S9 [Marinilactibacillus psychrotolerans]GEQ34731.1 dipeptidyl aminopeptidase / acylaminoacyl-peptidase [Marinilactibacillus psychrotolerans]
MKTIMGESLFELKTVSQPVVFQDNVFFVETIMDKEENEYRTSIYSVDQNTKERVHWGDSGSANIGISISPNGKWLAYVSNNTKNKKKQLFLIGLKGGSAMQLTEEKQGITNYEWNSNGSGIYYQTAQKTEEKEEEVNKKVPQPQIITKLEYKMDGTGIIPTDLTYQIKKIEIATKIKQLILEKDRPIGLSYVAKDESYLLYVDKLNPEDEWVYGGSIYKYVLSTDITTMLTSSVPDGSFQFLEANEAEDFYLLSGNDFEFAFVSQTKIYGYDVKTSRMSCLTENLDAEVGDTIIGDFQQNVSDFPVKWINNEEYLFPITEHGKLQVYKGDKKGKYEKLVDEKFHLTGGDLTGSENIIAVTYSTSVKPSAVGLLDLSTGKIEVLYDPNADFVSEHMIVEPEMFWYRGADDWKIQGWYMPPITQEEKHPAILYIHGGPQVNYGETFFHEMQKLSGQGYGVILLNPRGGNGYGQEFVASILGDYGNKDYEDLMIGTDYVLEKHPNIDKNNVYLAGGSYGGFMTNWIVGHTNRFKAAVTQRCISNWISFYGTSDIGPHFVEFQLQQDLSNMEELWRMSPLAYAQKVETPLLIIHGEEDLRCPQEQAEQMYIAMKKKGVETKLITFPKSSHGLSRMGLPNLRLERMDAISGWFEQH